MVKCKSANQRVEKSTIVTPCRAYKFDSTFQELHFTESTKTSKLFNVMTIQVCWQCAYKIVLICNFTTVLVCFSLPILYLKFTIFLVLINAHIYVLVKTRVGVFYHIYKDAKRSVLYVIKHDLPVF